MRLTERQAEVLAKLDLVRPLPIRRGRRRFILGDTECTQQIISLQVKGLVRLKAEGSLQRVDPQA